MWKEKKRKRKRIKIKKERKLAWARFPACGPPYLSLPLAHHGRSTPLTIFAPCLCSVGLRCRPAILAPRELTGGPLPSALSPLKSQPLHRHARRKDRRRTRRRTTRVPQSQPHNYSTEHVRRGFAVGPSGRNCPHLARGLRQLNPVNRSSEHGEPRLGFFATRRPPLPSYKGGPNSPAPPLL
jgi:hypothetical protein